MKPEYEKIAGPEERSFLAKVVSRPNRPLLSQAWHYHPEIEICFTKESKGKRFTGNQIIDYKAGDLVMFGSNLPHGFTTDVKSTQYVIQMTNDFLGREFIEKPELRKVRQLFRYAGRGLEFKGDTRKKAARLIPRLVNARGLQQLVYLLELLYILADSEEVKPICTEEYSIDLDATHLNRLKIVYDYIVSNFTSDLQVKTVADQINLTEAAFYKFIKKHTKKTFTEIVNEFRISHASKLLITTDMTVAEISFESGFNNISYFNRRFKAAMNMSPNDFRHQYYK